jgi:hypothetical protein
MKNYVFALCFSLAMLAPFQESRAQEQEIEQLILNIEKLLQFRQILADMKQGYEVLSQGYQLVKDISEGNFNLHKAFLDGLLEVSPAVQRYEKIAQIILMQGQLVNEYRVAFRRFSVSNLFNRQELDYIDRVYGQLLKTSVQQLGDLAAIITAGQLRMSDEERLKAIDALYDEMTEQLTFLRRFNNSTNVLLLQRLKERQDAGTILNMIK